MHSKFVRGEFTSVLGTIQMIHRVWSTAYGKPKFLEDAARPPAGPEWVHEIKHDGF
jgi:hypothetical protein